MKAFESRAEIPAFAPQPFQKSLESGGAPRSAALDRARTFLTIVVLIHHAVIPYTYFGHTDPTHWFGFDAIVLANDSYFMAMFFFLSGLFVWPSLAHRTSRRFINDRMLRLGLPFVVGALTVIPLAYYGVEPRSSTESFAAFWWRTITIGPWHSGPIWFTWVLLVFGIISNVVFRTAPNAVDPINRLSRRAFANPFRFFAVFVVATLLVYAPARLYFGPNHWFALGPIAVQASRVGLYILYFIFGAGIGAAVMERGLLGHDAMLPQRWLRYAILAALSYAALWGLIAVKREVLGNPDSLPHWYEFAYGLAFVLFSASMLFALLGYFLKFEADGWSWLDPLRNDAYGIFLVHYVFVLWIQYALFAVDLLAIVKALGAFIGTLLLSWATSAALRRIPGAQRVL